MRASLPFWIHGAPLQPGDPGFPNHGDPFVVMIVVNQDSAPVPDARWQVWQDAVLLFDSGAFGVGAFNQMAHTIVVPGYTQTSVVFTATVNGLPITQTFGGGLIQYTVTLPFVGALIPAMTDYTVPSGVASADSEYTNGYPAWRPFNQQTNSEFYAWLPEIDPGNSPFPRQTGWLAYEFPAPVVVRRYEITGCANHDVGSLSGLPKDWTFEGWDGAAWIVLNTHTNGSGEGVYSFSNGTSYIRYRLNVTATQTTNGLQIGNLQMFSA